MENYTIIVKVAADSQSDAFRFVEDALSTYLDRHEDLAPDTVHVSTPDGTHSTQMSYP